MVTGASPRFNEWSSERGSVYHSSANPYCIVSDTPVNALDPRSLTIQLFPAGSRLAGGELLISIGV